MSEQEQAASTGTETDSQAQPIESAPQPAETKPADIQAQVEQPAANDGKQQQPEQQTQTDDDEFAGLHPDSLEDAAKFGEEAKPDDEAADSEEINVVLPDDYTLDEDVMGGFKEVLKTAESKQDMAQKLMDIHVAEQRKLIGAIESRIYADAAKQNAEWAKQCRADPDFGGAKYDASSNYVTKAILEHVPAEERKEFVRVFNALKLNNQPHMRRFLARVGMANAESGPVNSGGNGGQSQKSLFNRMFSHIKED